MVKNFTLKLISSYVLVVLLSFGFIAFFLDKNLEAVYLREARNSLVQQAYLIGGRLASLETTAQGGTAMQALFQEIASKAENRVTLIDARGVVLADSQRAAQEIHGMENHANRPEIVAALRGQIGDAIRYSSTLHIDMLYVAVPVKWQGQGFAALRLALPLVSLQATLWSIRKAVACAFFFSLGLSLVIGWFLAGGIIRPVNKMIQISRRFSQGDFSRRIIEYPHDELGELAAALNKMAQDIQDRVKEEQIRSQHLSAVLNSMIEGVMVLDKAGRILSLNPTVERIFSVDAAQATGKYFLEAIRNTTLGEVIGSVLKQGSVVSRELALEWPVQKVFEINVSPVFENNAVSGCIAVIHDISEIRRLETVRKDFIANVSHELKTPLTSVKGFVETLLEGALDDKENNRYFLKIIQAHADRLNTLIDDLLSLSYLESSAAQVHKAPTGIYGLIDKVSLGFKAQLKKRGIEVKNEVPAGLSVQADKDKLEQVFTNLIDNAIKFNKDQGSVRVYEEVLPSGVKIVVEDSGMGIPQKDLSRIFERFYRVDKARSRQLGGTGLGLSIVKHIVELHGGTVGVQSTELTGSKFWFTLPG